MARRKTGSDLERNEFLPYVQNFGANIVAWAVPAMGTITLNAIVTDWLNE